MTKKFKIKTGWKDNSLFRLQKSTYLNAVDNLNLTVNNGQLFGLLGPNGAGKTTLIKTLCTLLPPDSGTAIINGYDIVKEPMQVKRVLGTLFSVGERGFFWRLNGYRNLEFFAAIYNVPRGKRHARILDVLKLVGLENNAFDLYQRYSGGMKRRLSLARTLLADPPILLLDEPTVGLDVISSRNIREFVRTTVKETGKTVLYTTHYIEEAAHICDKIAILRKGRIIACDTPDAIRSMIKEHELIYIAVENISSEQINRLRMVSGLNNLTEINQQSTNNERNFCLEIDRVESLPYVFDFLFKEKIKLLDFRREEPTLEDAFVELTRRT